MPVDVRAEKSNMSAPLPPVRLSTPSPPASVSMPSPPMRVSLPLVPVMVSSPLPPVIASALEPPLPLKLNTPVPTNLMASMLVVLERSEILKLTGAAEVPVPEISSVSLPSSPLTEATASNSALDKRNRSLPAPPMSVSAPPPPAITSA